MLCCLVNISPIKFTTFTSHLLPALPRFLQNAIARNRATFMLVSVASPAMSGSAFNARRTICPSGTASSEANDSIKPTCVSSNICCICAIAAMALPNQPPEPLPDDGCTKPPIARIAPAPRHNRCASGVERLECRSSLLLNNLRAIEILFAKHRKNRIPPGVWEVHKAARCKARELIDRGVWIGDRAKPCNLRD